MGGPTDVTVCIVVGLVSNPIPHKQKTLLTGNTTDVFGMSQLSGLIVGKLSHFAE